MRHVNVGRHLRMAILAAGLGLLGSGWAWAGEDQIIGPIPIQRVTISNIAGGKVLYTTSTGEKKTFDLSNVRRLVLENNAAFTEAEQQFDQSNWLAAARKYEEAVRKITAKDQSGLRDYALDKQMKAWARGKDFAKVFEVYAAFRALNPAAAEAALPAEKPEPNSKELAAAIKALESRYAAARGDDKAQWGRLLVGYYNHAGLGEKAEAVLKDLAGAAPPTPAAGQSPAAGQTPSAASVGQGDLVLQQIQTAVARKDWDKVLADIEANSSKVNDRQLADVMYFRGLAKFNKGEFAAAGVDFMWVWANGLGKSVRKAESLYMAGQVLEKLGKPAEAKAVYSDLLAYIATFDRASAPAVLRKQVEESLKAVGG